MKIEPMLNRLPILFICLVTVLTCACITIPSAYGNSTAEVLTVGVPPNRCPVFYEDSKTGEIAGIGVDLMRAAAKEAGYSVSFKFIEEKTLKHALDNETYDVVMPFGSAIRSAAGKQSIISENLMQTPFTLVTVDNQIHEAPQINKLRIGMQQSLAAGSETVRQLYPGVEIILYEDMPECMRALRDGKVDALLHNSYVWSYVLQKPAYSDLTVQPSAVFSMDFRVGALDTPKGREIIERLNTGISKLSDDDRQEIITNYTSRQIYEYDFSDYVHQYGLVCLLCVVLVVGLAVVLYYVRR